MLIAEILNSSAVLNSFEPIGGMEFIPGEQITLVIRLLQAQREDQLRFVVEDVAGEVSVSLPKTDGTDLEKDMIAMSGDRSVWSVELSETETEDLLGGNFTFSVDTKGDGTEILKGWAQNGMSRIITGNTGC